MADTEWLKEERLGMETYEDQRVFDRFIARFPVRFEDSRDDFGRHVFLRDMSAQGARLLSRSELPIHDNIALQVKLPDGYTELTLNGQIVWIKSKSPGSWEIGLKFHKIKLMALQKLFKFCQ